MTDQIHADCGKSRAPAGQLEMPAARITRLDSGCPIPLTPQHPSWHTGRSFHKCCPAGGARHDTDGRRRPAGIWLTTVPRHWSVQGPGWTREQNRSRFPSRQFGAFWPGVLVPAQMIRPECRPRQNSGGISLTCWFYPGADAAERAETLAPQLTTMLSRWAVGLAQRPGNNRQQGDVIAGSMVSISCGAVLSEEALPSPVSG